MTTSQPSLTHVAMYAKVNLTRLATYVKQPMAPNLG
jgi:hypothetical protein